jgi:hypothetical protein
MNAKELRGIEFLFQGIQVLAQQMAAAQVVQFGVVSCPSNPFDVFRKHKLNARPTCGSSSKLANY